MSTNHKIILADSQKMPELANNTVQLMITSPPYPMIQMWDDLFSQINHKTLTLWEDLSREIKKNLSKKSTVACMKTWATFAGNLRVLVDWV
jgi:DNA modification methylase